MTGRLHIITKWVVGFHLIGMIFVYQSQASKKGFSHRHFSQSTGQYELKIMTYNVLNLYDNVHRKGKRDFIFLPFGHPQKNKGCNEIRSPWYRDLCLNLNWTDTRINKKITQIKRVVNAQGSLPDLLALQEIENKRIINRLGKSLGYKKHIVTNGPDKKGLNVALYYNPEKLEYVSHRTIDLHDKNFPNFACRETLRVHFRIRGHRKDHILAVYVNHWPANPLPPSARFNAGNIIKRDLQKQFKNHGSKYHAVVLGDFNVYQNEFPNGLSNVLHNKAWKNYLVDSEWISRQTKNPAQKYMPNGTYYFDKEWKKFDRILVSQNFEDGKGIELIGQSYRILYAGFMTKLIELKTGNVKQVRVPWRYDFLANDYSELGYSDHLPVIVKLKY